LRGELLSFELELAQPEFLSISSLNKMYGTGEFGAVKEDLSPKFLAYSSMHKLRGPEDQKGNFPKFVSLQNSPCTKCA
jgi:hypothetical protein